MTHPASGNPTWEDWPSTATLITAARLEAIEGVLDRTAGSVQARAAANQMITTAGTWTAVALPIEDLDDANVHSTTTNTGRFLWPNAGLYRISAQVTWATGETTADPLRQMRLANPDGGIPGSFINNQYAGNYLTMTLPPILVEVAAGAWVQLEVATGRANTTLFGSASAGARMTAERVR